MLSPEAVTAIAETIGLSVWPSFIERARCDKKEIWLNGGWRGGKSATLAFLIFIRIFLVWLRREGTHLVWLVGPDYEQARAEYFYLSSWCGRLGLQVEASSAQQGSLRMVISRQGHPGIVEVVTKSATDPTSLGSVAPVIIGVCEAGQISEEGWMWIQGRTAEKNADVILGGTFENDDGKAQYAWFEQESDNAWTSPSTRREAFRLPTWENNSLYDSCLKMITEDSSLGIWCPNQDHGTSHSGLNHPMIRQLQDRWKDRPRDWAKRFGGEPQGVANPVYEWSLLDKVDDISGNKYLVSMSEVQARIGNFIWTFTAGGIDPGLVHPAGLTIASRNQHGDIWVRNAKKLQSSNNAELYAVKDLWQRQYFVAMWGGDPVGLRYSRPTENIIPMTGTVWNREERAAIVNSYAIGIDNLQHLYFDADVPGVREAFAEFKTIHRKKRQDGQWGYDRTDDDMAAATENAITVIHSRQFSIPETVPFRRYQRTAPQRQRVRI